MTHHLNRLFETVQLRGNNICFYAELTKIIKLIITKYSLLSRVLHTAFPLEKFLRFKLEEHPKRRSTVQSLPSDYSDVQPKSYDPAFISDISNKMQVPDTISVKGAGDYEKSGSQPIWDDPPQRHEMKVPDRIMVAGEIGKLEL